jgi:hypothetical protein
MTSVEQHSALALQVRGPAHFEHRLAPMRWFSHLRRDERGRECLLLAKKGRLNLITAVPESCVFITAGPYKAVCVGVVFS